MVFSINLLIKNACRWLKDSIQAPISTFNTVRLSERNFYYIKTHISRHIERNWQKTKETFEVMNCLIQRWHPQVHLISFFLLRWEFFSFLAFNIIHDTNIKKARQKEEERYFYVKKTTFNMYLCSLLTMMMMPRIIHIIFIFKKNSKINTKVTDLPQYGKSYSWSLKKKMFCSSFSFFSLLRIFHTSSFHSLDW